MKIQVIGSGVVGQATGKGFARYGHEVRFYDINDAVLRKLSDEGYTVGPPADADVHFICVPEKLVESVVGKWFSNELFSGLVVIRSTVPPGTAKRLSESLERCVCSNPEFLREALAEFDFLNPPGILIGECCDEHGKMLADLYAPFRRLTYRVSCEVAELTKLALNGYLACQISYWNSVKYLAEKLGINSQEVGCLACIVDGRVSPYGARMHGKAYGGACLPKDIEQLIALCKQVGTYRIMFESIKSVNKIVREDR